MANSGQSMQLTSPSQTSLWLYRVTGTLIAQLTQSSNCRHVILHKLEGSLEGLEHGARTLHITCTQGHLHPHYASHPSSDSSLTSLGHLSVFHLNTVHSKNISDHEASKASYDPCFSASCMAEKHVLLHLTVTGETMPRTHSTCCHSQQDQHILLACCLTTHVFGKQVLLHGQDSGSCYK